MLWIIYAIFFRFIGYFGSTHEKYIRLLKTLIFYQTRRKKN